MMRRIGFSLYFLLFSFPVYAHAVGAGAAILVTGLVAAGITGVGMIASNMAANDAIDAQEEENRKARKLEAQLTREQLAEAKRQFGLELGIKEEELGLKAQQQTFDNTQVIGNKFMNAMNRNHGTAKSFYEMAERKRLKQRGTQTSKPIGEFS